MINNKKVLVYIPARSGSKGIKDKNIIEICNKPLIHYSIDAAKKSKYVDKVIVSTDSERYAKIAKDCGAEVPFIRPTELAQDNSVEIDSAIHTLDWINKNLNEHFDIIIKLQPTSPLRTSEDIGKALELFIEKDADSVISVSESAISPFWMNTLPEDHSMKDFISENTKITNRQQLPKYYQLNGSIFISTPEIIHKRTWYGERSFAYVMPQERSIDIDNQLDLEFVRFIIKKSL